MRGQGTNDNIWPPERVDELTRLLADGLSASQIALKIGGSRSAIIGKAYRLGLLFGSRKRASTPRDISVVREKMAAAKPQAVKVTPPSAPRVLGAKVEAVIVDELAVAPIDRDIINGCQWPIGETVCGDVRSFRSSYCDCHHREAYNGAAPRQRPSQVFCRLPKPFQMPIERVR